MFIEIFLINLKSRCIHVLRGIFYIICCTIKMKAKSMKHKDSLSKLGVQNVLAKVRLPISSFPHWHDQRWVYCSIINWRIIKVRNNCSFSISIHAAACFVLFTQQFGLVINHRTGVIWSWKFVIESFRVNINKICWHISGFIILRSRVGGNTHCSCFVLGQRHGLMSVLSGRQIHM